MPPKLKRSDGLGNQVTDSYNDIDTSDAAVEAELNRISSIVRSRMQAFPQQMVSTDGSLSHYLLNDGPRNRRNSLPIMQNFTQPVPGVSFPSIHHQGQAKTTGNHPSSIVTDAELRRSSLADDENTRAMLRMATNQHMHTQFDAASFHTPQVNSSSHYLLNNDACTSRPLEHRRNSLPGMSNLNQPVPGVSFPSTHHHGQSRTAGNHPSSIITDAKLRRSSLADEENKQAMLRMATNQHMHTQFDAASFHTPQANENYSLSNSTSDKYEHYDIFPLTQEQEIWSNEIAASFDSQVNLNRLANGITGKSTPIQEYPSLGSKTPYSSSERVCAGDSSNEQSIGIDLSSYTDIMSSSIINDVNENHTSGEKEEIGYADVDEDEIIAYYKSLDG